jgi:ABC-type branched-subunit amino acid transport system substrate-binding protein
MKKILGIIAIVFILAIAIFTTNKNEEVLTGKPVIKIGSTLPLTGNLAESGQTMLKAVNMALEDFNSDSNNQYQYELIKLDDQGKPSQAVLNFNRLNDMSNVDVFVNGFAHTSAAVADVANSKQVPHFSFSVNSDLADKEYQFVNCTQSESHAKRIMEFIDEKQYSKIALITMNQHGVNNLEAILVDEIAKVDSIDIVHQSKINFGDKDFNIMLQKSEQQSPDLYLLVIFNPEIDILRKQMLEVGIDTPMLADDFVSTSSYKNAFNGQIAIEQAIGNKEFRDRFAKNHPEASMYAAATYYDNIGLIVNAYENIDKDVVESSDVALYLKNIKDYKGMSAVLNSNGGVFDPKPSVLTIENGVVVVLEE